jgi:hypothetical protein
LVNEEFFECEGHLKGRRSEEQVERRPGREVARPSEPLDFGAFPAFSTFSPLLSPL